MDLILGLQVGGVTMAAFLLASVYIYVFTRLGRWIEKRFGETASSVVMLSGLGGAIGFLFGLVPQ